MNKTLIVYWIGIFLVVFTVFGVIGPRDSNAARAKNAALTTWCDEHNATYIEEWNMCVRNENLIIVPNKID